MTNLSIQLDPVALREATSQAIMGILTPEVRAQILQSAIRSLLAPSTNSWDRGKSPIDTAFEVAVNIIAREEAKRLVTEDEAISAQIKSLIRAATERMLTSDPEKLAERMAGAFVDSLRSRD